MYTSATFNGGGKWTASEVFPFNRWGFGTYQLIVEGNVFDVGKFSVFGLFPYEPGDIPSATMPRNEIEIEFSGWNNTGHGGNADFTVYPYPSTGNHNQMTIPPGNHFQVGGGATRRPGSNGCAREHRAHPDEWRSRDWN